jgi:hypothetical protein
MARSAEYHDKLSANAGDHDGIERTERYHTAAASADRCFGGLGLGGDRLGFAGGAPHSLSRTTRRFRGIGARAQPVEDASAIRPGDLDLVR